MNTVYTIAFKENEFLMVFNPKRNGWEMPGGKIESGENVTDAAKREYLEESGYTINIIGTIKAHGCHVCAATLKRRLADGELESKMFTELPDELAFDRSEYDGVLEWAKSVIKKK